MQIESRMPGTPRSADIRGVPATIVSVEPSQGTMTVQLGERTVQIPLQEGIQSGDRVIFRQLSDGNIFLQKVPQATASVAQPIPDLASDLGSLLDYLERKVVTTDPASVEAKALVKSVLPGFADPTLPPSEVRRLFTQISDLLLDQSLPELRAIEPKLQQTLAKIFPAVSLGTPLVPQAQELIGSLASNDFQAANANIQKVISIISDKKPFTPKELALFSRLLQPLQELDSWGSPAELSAPQVKQLRVELENILALPLSKTAKVALPSESPARISSLQGNTLQLDIPLPNGSTIPLECKLPLDHPLRQQLREGSLVTLKLLPELAPDALPQNQTPQAFENTPKLITDKQQILSALTQRISAPGIPTPAIPPQRVLIQPDAAYLPENELPAHIASKTPITANLVDAHKFLQQYGEEIPPARVAQFAQILHQVEVNLPHGQALTEEQKDLVLRWMLTQKDSNPKITPDLAKGLSLYSPEGDAEPELFKALPLSHREALEREATKTGAKPISPKALLNILEQVPIPPNATPAEREAIHQLQKQVQWTQMDQDTRPPSERQEVVYFFNGQELQKARIQLRKEPQDKSKGSEKKEPELHFFVETRTSKLGKVHVDFRVREGKVELDFADSSGAAGAMVEKERPALAKELEQIGFLLGSVLYRNLNAVAEKGSTSPATPPPPPTSTRGILDLRA